MSTNETQETQESKAQGLLALVAEKVKESGPVVYQRMVETLVEKEISDRVNLLDKALQKRFQLQVDLRKANKPDVETFNADGSTATQSFTKGKLEEIKKAKEALEKHEQALEKALASNDWNRLKETCK